MVSFHTDDELLRAPKEQRRRRCLACGRQVASSELGVGPDRCEQCVASNRQVDLVMRWIWQDAVG